MSEVGRIAPVPDRLKYAPSNGALYLDYLRARAHELDSPPAWKKLPPDYDRQCFEALNALQRHCNFMIQVGVR